MARSRRDTRPSADTMTIDEYLTHSSSSGGAGYLKNWKEDGSVVIWLHPQGVFAAPWFFRFFRMVKDRESDELKVRTWRIRSMERDAVMKKQHFREDDGSREYPPETCAFAKTIEWVHQAVLDGTIEDTDVIWSFDPGNDEDEPIEIHAGGFTGQIQKKFRDKDVTKEDRKRYREAHINGTEIWRENCTARLNYIYVVVQERAPEDGPVIAIEGKTIGDLMKKVIRDRREDLGDNEGNPLENPVAFKWLFDDEEEFSRKYDVKVRTSIELSDAVRDAFDQEAPSLDPVLERYNVAELRLTMEEAWCHPDVTPPWDELFADALEAVKGTELAELPSDFNPENYEKEEEEESDAKGEKEEEEELFECDSCGKPMPAVDTCPHCGAKYDKDGNLIEEPPKKEEEPEPPKPRKRSESGKAAKKDEEDEEPPAREPRRRSSGKR